MNVTRIKKNILLILSILFVLAAAAVAAQDLSLGQNDFRIEQRTADGFHLYIRKKPDIASVLLTESTRDPSMREDNYAYRASEWNPINGDEIRLLNGVPLSRLYSLVSSSPVPHNELGEAFHIYIPWIIHYGYESGRHGEEYVRNGTFINIRAFTLPYADYRGSFADNPFVLQVVQRVNEKPEGRFSNEAESAFKEIAQGGNGDFTYAGNPEEMLVKIEDILKKEAGKKIDLVICLDTTASMRPYINIIRTGLVNLLRRRIADFPSARLGLVLYKDYYEEYLTRVFPFTEDFAVFQRNLNAARDGGGGDIPEAVYEALYDAADKFPWAAESRQVILIGDAPPHPRPRGRITKEMVFRMAADKRLAVNVILLPY